jgi:hypothetical protein
MISAPFSTEAVTKNVRKLRNWFENKVMAAFQINTVPVGFVMVIPLEAGAR